MSKVSSKHQVTLPVSVLKDGGLAAGDEVVIRAVGRGRIEVERAEDVIDRYAGSRPAGTYRPATSIACMTSGARSAGRRRRNRVP